MWTSRCSAAPDVAPHLRDAPEAVRGGSRRRRRSGQGGDGQDSESADKGATKVGHGAYSLTSRCARQPEQATTWPTPHSPITCQTDKSTRPLRPTFRVPLLLARGSVVEFLLPLMTSTRHRNRNARRIGSPPGTGTRSGTRKRWTIPPASGQRPTWDRPPRDLTTETPQARHDGETNPRHDPRAGAREDKARMFTPTTCRRSAAADHVLPACGRTHHLSVWTEKAVTAEVVTSDYFPVKSGLTCTPSPDLAHGEVRGGSPTMTPAAAPAAPRHDLASVRPLSAPTRGGASLPYNTMKTGE